MTDLGVIAAGVLIGSATGIGGAILGAWMNGRSQMAGLRLSIAAEDHRAHEDTKRHVYASCIAGLNAWWPMAIKYRASRQSGDSQRIMKSMADLDETEMVAANARGEVELIAPDEITAAVEAVFEQIGRYVQVSGVAERLFDPGPTAYDGIKELRALMRRDLKAGRADSQPIDRLGEQSDVSAEGQVHQDPA